MSAQERLNSLTLKLHLLRLMTLTTVFLIGLILYLSLERVYPHLGTAVWLIPLIIFLIHLPRNLNGGKELNRKLRLLPLELILRNATGSAAEMAYLVYYDYQQVLKKARIGKPSFQFFIEFDEGLNAYCSGDQHRGAIVFSLSFPLMFEASERQAAIAHELKHLLNHDSFFLFLFHVLMVIPYSWVGLLLIPTVFLTLGFLPTIAYLFLTFFVYPYLFRSTRIASEEVADIYSIVLGFGEGLAEFFRKSCVIESLIPGHEAENDIYHPNVYSRIEMAERYSK